jgi:hypothetical protein
MKFRMPMKKVLANWWTPPLLWPLLVGAFIRLAVLASALAHFGIQALLADWGGDQYERIAQGLLRTGALLDSSGRVNLDRTPGYPLFLVLTGWGGPVSSLVVQALVSLLAIIVVWRLTRVVFGGEYAPLLAAWLIALEPLSIAHSIIPLSDSVSVIPFLMCLERLATFVREQRLWLVAQSGLWLTVATFVRPGTYYLPILLAIWLFLVLRHTRAMRWKAPAIFLISIVPWLAAWQGRNWVETGYPGFTTIDTTGLYHDYAGELISKSEHRPLGEVWKELSVPGEPDFEKSHPGSAAWSVSQQEEFMRSYAVHVIEAHPALSLRMQVDGALRVMFLPPGPRIVAMVVPPKMVALPDGKFTLLQKGVYAEAARVAHYPVQVVAEVLLGLALAGLYLFALRGILRGGVAASYLWLLLMPCAYIVAISAGGDAVNRYRLPIMPVLCVLAAVGIQNDLQRIRSGAPTKPSMSSPES